MINKNNIISYIQFLYRRKNGTDAPEALLEKWRSIPEAEILTRLDHLYESWNYNLVQRGALVQEFINVNVTNTAPVNTTASIKSTPTYQALPANEPPSKSVVTTKQGNTFMRILSTILLVVAFCGGLFLAYKYYHFTHLHQLYTLTERVAIRTDSGVQIGTLDLNANGQSNSYQELTAYDKEIYNRSIDSTGKLYEHRKVLMVKDNFIKFLQSKPELFAYVNAKYVVDNKAEYELYKRLFGQLNTDDNKWLQLKHRKIIAGCIKRNDGLKNLYALSACDEESRQVRRNASGIVVDELVNETKYQIIVRLSDGFYYLMIGDVNSEVYEVPKRLGYVEFPNRDDEYLAGDLLFKHNKKNGNYYLVNCKGQALPYVSNYNKLGELLCFRKIEPIESPMQPLEEFTEEAQDALQGVKEMVDAIFN